MKSPIKAHIENWKYATGKVIKKAPVFCHLADKDPVDPGLSIMLSEDGEDIQTSIIVSLDSLLSALNKRGL